MEGGGDSADAAAAAAAAPPVTDDTAGAAAAAELPHLQQQLQPPPPSSSSSSAMQHQQQMHQGPPPGGYEDPPVEEDTVKEVHERREGKQEEHALWLDAYHNPLAGVAAFSGCLELSDLHNNGDYKLLVADETSKLKIFSGTDLVMESPLLDVPCAIASFYTDCNDPNHRPAIAVASGPAVYVYKNLRPFYKFYLPCVEISSVETDLWANMRQKSTSAATAVEALEMAKENGVSLSTRSLEFLSLETADERTRFIEGVKDSPLIQQTVITCLAVLKKDKEDDTGVGYLIIGTENNRVLILDSQFQILRKVQLPAPPVFICTTGLYDVDYRIVIACRNGSISTIKNGEPLSVAIELESQICGMVRVDKSIVVGTMSNTVHAYHVKGKKQYSLYMPAAITNMAAICQETQKGSKACIIALANGEVRVYNGKILINTVQIRDIVTGMRFGRYGREDATLIMTTVSGAVIIKILPRLANLEVQKGVQTGPPAEQSIPLKVPKKTRLYVEQTEREKQFGIEMHRVFQRDLCKLRLQTARAYVKILTDGQGPLSYTGGSSLRLTAHVQGLGPLFKIKLNIQNTGLKPLTGIPIVFTYNASIYHMKKPHMVCDPTVPPLCFVSLF